MLANLSIHNFLCIKDLCCDLLYEGRAPLGYKDSDSHTFIEFKDHRRIQPILALYGANGSGKSTIFKALCCLKFLLKDGLK